MVDLNAERLATAELLGCTGVASSAAEFDGEGWDVVIDATGNAADLVATGVLDPEVFISHREPLADHGAALARFQAGQGRKIQVLP
ncbi:hypothetical protein GCM10010492_36820 [Saccharothrix mutabilis subsp. mutabilis]|uniref:Uncharacterized protein n=1 Tax=Saccharothrix mutabilis subsp. mutabilis TaxID=66855 RepID=A0ABN0U016_9PSEU